MSKMHRDINRIRCSDGFFISTFRRFDVSTFRRLLCATLMLAVAAMLPTDRTVAETAAPGESSMTAEAAATKFILVSSFTCSVPGCQYEDAVLRYDATTGAFAGVHIDGIPGPYGMAIHPQRGTLLVVSRASDLVNEYNLTTGAFLRTLVTAGDEGLHFPQNILFKADGNLLVTSMQTNGFLDRFNGILEFSGDDGSFVGVFVEGGLQGFGCGDEVCLFGPNGMAYGPNGHLYVASGTNSLIIEYDGITGDYIGHFDSTRLVSPSGITVRPAGSTRAGNILVTSLYRDPTNPNDTDKILEFSPVTRELINPGAVFSQGFKSPGPLFWHEDGYLLVGDRLFWDVQPISSDKLLKLHPTTGAFLGAFTPISDVHLHWSTALLAVSLVPSNVNDDYDLDGDVDLVDFAEFQICFGVSPSAECLDAFDDDLSGTVDLVDMPAFRNNFSGPQR